MIARRVHGRGQSLLVAGFLAPSLLLITVFVVAPGAWAVILSFTDWQLTGPKAQHPTFIGLQNYARLASSGPFQDAFGRTVTFVLWSAIVGQFVFGLLAALLIARRDMRIKGFWGAAILMPLVV